MIYSFSYHSLPICGWSSVEHKGVFLMNNNKWSANMTKKHHKSSFLTLIHINQSDELLLFKDVCKRPETYNLQNIEWAVPQKKECTNNEWIYERKLVLVVCFLTNYSVFRRRRDWCGRSPNLSPSYPKCFFHSDRLCSNSCINNCPVCHFVCDLPDTVFTQENVQTYKNMQYSQ